MAYQKRNFKKDQLLTADDLNAMDDQIASNEESAKKANDDIKNKLDKSAVVKEKGDSETAVMSQAAATEEFDKLSEEIGNKIERAIIQNGNNFISYSTKENTLTFPANITFVGNKYHSGFAEEKTLVLLDNTESTMQVVLLNKTTNDLEVFYYYTYKNINKANYLYICGIRLVGTSAAPAIDIGVPYTIDGGLFGVYEHKELSSPRWVKSVSGMPSIVQEPDYTTTLTLPKGGAVMYADKIMVFAEEITLPMMSIHRTNFSIVYVRIPDNDVWENNVTETDFIVVPHYDSQEYAARADCRYVCNVRMKQGTAGPSTDIGIPWMWNGVLYDVVDDTLSKEGMPADAKKTGEGISVSREYFSTVHITEKDTLYPIYLEAGGKLSIKTADGSSFHSETRMFFYDENKNNISESGWDIGAYGNRRDITVAFIEGKTVARYCSFTQDNHEILLVGDISQVSKNITELYNEFLKGTKQPTTFQYVGEKIPSKVHHYDSEKIMTMTYTGMTSQDIDIYGNYLFVSFSVVKQIRVYALDTMELVAELPLENFKGNAMQFSKEFYADGDAFPLLYLGGEHSKTSVVRIQLVDGVWGADVVKTISIPTPDYGYHISPALDADNNVLYGFGYREDSDNNYSGTNSMILTKWDLNRLTENEDGTYTPTQIGNKTECPYIGTTQGRKYYQGNIYIGTANTSNPHNSKLVVIDAGTGDVKTTVDMTGVTMSENEGVCYQIVDGNIYWYYSDYYNIFKLTF